MYRASTVGFRGEEVSAWLGFRIKKLGEARIVRHVIEIDVAARLDAILGIEADGARQVIEALLRLSRDAVEHRQAIMRIIGPRGSS